MAHFIERKMVLDRKCRFVFLLTLLSMHSSLFGRIVNASEELEEAVAADLRQLEVAVVSLHGVFVCESKSRAEDNNVVGGTTIFAIRKKPSGSLQSDSVWKIFVADSEPTHNFEFSDGKELDFHRLVSRAANKLSGQVNADRLTYGAQGEMASEYFRESSVSIYTERQRLMGIEDVFPLSRRDRLIWAEEPAINHLMNFGGIASMVGRCYGQPSLSELFEVHRLRRKIVWNRIDEQSVQFEIDDRAGLFTVTLEKRNDRWSLKRVIRQIRFDSQLIDRPSWTVFHPEDEERPSSVDDISDSARELVVSFEIEVTQLGGNQALAVPLRARMSQSSNIPISSPTQEAVTTWFPTAESDEQALADQMDSLFVLPEGSRVVYVVDGKIDGVRRIWKDGKVVIDTSADAVRALDNEINKAKAATNPAESVRSPSTLRGSLTTLIIGGAIGAVVFSVAYGLIIRNNRA
jgi:hypothetical protein